MNTMNDNLLQKLSDRNSIPDEELIFNIIGERRVYWQRIIKYASDNYRETSGMWNYYNDGKSWLFKFQEKRKTLFWAGILNDTFRITFWFADKAEKDIESAVLPPALKDEFKNARKYGSVRAVSVIVMEQSDADAVMTLISIKHKLK
jgi:hypothetical protein